MYPFHFAKLIYYLIPQAVRLPKKMKGATNKNARL